VCDRLGLCYFVTGSTATIAYGEPRLTNDIVIVIDLPADRIADFCAGFPNADFSLSPAAVTQAVAMQHQFNVLHPGSGLNINFMVLTESEFDQSRRGRRRQLAVLPGRSVPFAAPEDVILKKLTYYREGGSEKHLRDMAGVLRVQGEALDRRYVEGWAAKLRVSDLWQQMVEREKMP
jgi:hypothetical protein